jgi:hypothetical protein
MFLLAAGICCFVPTSALARHGQIAKKIYIMAGNLEGARRGEAYSANDLANLFRKDGYVPIMNPNATADALAEAIRDPSAEAIIWMGHSHTRGGISDTNGEIIPKEVFQTPGQAFFPLFVPISCNAKTCVIEHYSLEGKPHLTLAKGATTLPLRRALNALIEQYLNLKDYIKKSRCQALLEST